LCGCCLLRLSCGGGLLRSGGLLLCPLLLRLLYLRQLGPLRGDVCVCLGVLGCHLIGGLAQDRA
jgi:hypothetical protein